MAASTSRAASQSSHVAARSLQQSRRRSAQPIQLLNRIIEAAGQRGDLHGVIRALQQIEQSGKPNVFTLNAVLNAVLRCGCSHDILDEMWDRMTVRHGVAANTVSYNTMLKRYVTAPSGSKRSQPASPAQHSSSSRSSSSVESALQLVQQMHTAGVPLDAVTYNTLLHICISAGQLQQAEQLLQRMAAAGAAPTAYTLSVLLRGYGAAGQPLQALACFDSMRAAGVAPNAVAYSVLAGVCLDHGMAQRAVQALQVRDARACCACTLASTLR